MSIKLDFGNFKHKDSDDESTTLEHNKSGHTVKLFHNVLSKDNREQLKSLKNGKEDKNKYGKVTDSKGNKPQVFADGGIVQALDDFADRISGQKKPEKVSKEGKVPQQTRIPPKDKGYRMYENYAEGGEVNPIDEALTVDVNKPVKTTQEEFLAGARERNTPFEGANPGSVDMLTSLDLRMKADQQAKEAAFEESQATSAAKAASEELNMSNALRAQAGLAPLPGPESAVGAEMAPTEGGLGAQPSAVPQQGMAATPPAVDPQMTGYNSQIQGLQQQAQALGEQGKAEALALDENRAAQLEAKAAFQQSSSELKQQADAYLNDIKAGYIDPNKFWTGYTAPNGSKVDGHSKVGAIIGMLVAGFGGNDGAAMLDKEIDRSIDAQKQNLQSSHNLLKANMDQYKNISDAYTATRMQLNDDIQNRLQKAAAVAKSPLAQAAAKQQIGVLQVKQAELAQSLALSQAINKVDLKNPNSSRAVNMMLDQLEKSNPERAKRMRETFVPGVGFANNKEDRDTLVQVQERRNMIKDNTQKAIDMIKKHGTYEALGPHNETLNGLMDQVATDMAKLTDPNSVARPGEVELVKKSLATAGLDSQNSTAIKQLENFYKTIDQRAAGAFKQRGLTPPAEYGVGVKAGLDSQKASALSWANSNVNSSDSATAAKAAKILKVLGQK